MKRRSFQIFHYILLAVLLVLVWIIQANPAMGQWYATSVYPFIAKVLFSLSGCIPFSLGDLFIFLSIVEIIIYPFVARFRKKKWKKILLNVATYLVWVYVWFYLAWGLNYSQPDFYRRTHVPYSPYSEKNFRRFLNEYVDSLNSSYVPVKSLNKPLIHLDIIDNYRKLDRNMGVHAPASRPRVKTMMFSSLFTSMGISGYMGPFFCEFNLNGELLPAQYPSTYAHELAHLLGITSEAEANFYAYQVCTRSDVPEVRFCGYFAVMNYILGNARGFLTEDEYKELIFRIRPEIIELSREINRFWTENYSQLLSDIQGKIYDLYLKGNKIPGGRKNYSEVVGLLISWYEYTGSNASLPEQETNQIQ